MTEKEQYESLKTESWNNSIHAFAFSDLFDYRAGRLKKYITLLKVFGLGIPAIVGFCFVSREYFVFLLTPLRYIAVLALLFQFVASILASFYQWDDELAYAYEASQAYNYFWVRFKKLSEYPPPTYDELRIQYDLLHTEVLARSQQDSKHGIKDWEVRRGHRAALREYNRACAKCGEVPTSMKLTETSINCGVCGDYKEPKFLTFK